MSKENNQRKEPQGKNKEVECNKLGGPGWWPSLTFDKRWDAVSPLQDNERDVCRAACTDHIATLKRGGHMTYLIWHSVTGAS